MAAAPNRLGLLKKVLVVFALLILIVVLSGQLFMSGYGNANAFQGPGRFDNRAAFPAEPFRDRSLVAVIPDGSLDAARTKLENTLAERERVGKTWESRNEYLLLTKIIDAKIARPTETTSGNSTVIFGVIGLEGRDIDEMLKDAETAFDSKQYPKARGYLDRIFQRHYEDKVDSKQMAKAAYLLALVNHAGGDRSLTDKQWPKILAYYQADGKWALSEYKVASQRKATVHAGRFELPDLIRQGGELTGLSIVESFNKLTDQLERVHTYQ